MEFESIGRETLSEILNAEYGDECEEDDLSMGIFTDPFGMSLDEEDLFAETGDEMFEQLNGLNGFEGVDDKDAERFGRFLKNTESQIDWMNNYLDALDNMEKMFNAEELEEDTDEQ